MRVHILGSGAGGGFPQWNCNCPNCRGVREGTIRARPRTQSSITVSANGTDWVLFNASPDIRAQLEAFPAMQPARALRDTAICAVLLVDSQIDHTTGLMMLREKGTPLDIYCTDEVHQDLSEGYPLLRVLGHYCGVHWHPLPVGGREAQSFTIAGAGELSFAAVPLKSEAPPYSPHRHNTRAGDNIGVWVQDPLTGKTLFYAPGLGQIEAHILPYLERADCVLVDGTVWTDDEMLRTGVGTKPAREMGHLALSGPGGIVETLNRLERPRKVLIHINNTNPILDEDSPQRAELTRLGIEVAHDGMDISL